MNVDACYFTFVFLVLTTERLGFKIQACQFVDLGLGDIRIREFFETSGQVPLTILE